MKLAIVIPARNEAACIAAVLNSIPNELRAQVIVVDNGSTDETAQLARAAGAQVISEPRRGYGSACFAGTTHLRDDIEAIAFLDADGSDDPSLLVKLLEPIACAEADFVVGARTLGDARKNLTPQQRFGNSLAAGLISLLWRHRYLDLGPMRVIRRDAFERFEMLDRTWGWPIEMQIKAIEHKLRIREIQVPYRPRIAGKSQISGTLGGAVGAGTKILSTIGVRWLACHAVAVLCLGLVIECAGLAFMLPNGDFRLPGCALRFMMAAVIASLGYGAAVWALGRRAAPVALCWAVAIGFRGLLLRMAPGDDIWRYLWEGRILNLGFNVWKLAPNSPALAPFRDAYWPDIVLPNLPAIYTLATETVFRGLAAIWYHPLCFKLAFVAADLAAVGLSIKLAAQTGTGKHRVWWYAWNPLVIYAFAGGGHFDSLMIACGLASLVLLLAKRDGWSVALLGLAISFKLVYLVAIPFYVAALRRKVWLALLVPFIALATIARLRAAPHPWYMSHFVWFNAIVFCAGAAVVYFKYLRKPVEGTHHMLGLLLVTSPVYHPWYLTWALSLGPFVRERALWVWAVSSFAYFFFWDDFAKTGEFHSPSPLKETCFWAPFLLFLAWECWAGWRGRRLGA